MIIPEYLAARTRAMILVGTTALAATACGAGDPARQTEVVRTDSAGVEVVVYPGRDLALDWNARRLFTLGGEEEGPESFYFLAPGMVDTDRDGRIYVLDINSSSVAVFDADGEFVRLQGGAGSGPGEFHDGNGIAVSPEGVASVFNFGKGGFVRFDNDGAILPELSFQEFPTWSKQRHVAVAGDGYVVSANAASPTGDRRTHQLRLITSGQVQMLAELEPVALSRLLIDRCGGGINRAPVFAPDLVWDAQAGRIAANVEPGYTVTIIEEGRRVRSVRRALDATPASRALALAEMAEGLTMNFGHGPCKISPEELVDGLGFAEVVPVILNVRLAPDGALWVERRAGDGDGAPRIDLFDPTGAYQGTLPEGTPLPLLILPGGRVAVVERDEFDVDRLVVMQVELGSAWPRDDP